MNTIWHNLLKNNLEVYNEITDESFSKLLLICNIQKVKEGESLISLGEMTDSIYFLCSGLLRAYTVDSHDCAKEYNKIFFTENMFPASMSALVSGTESQFAIEALEDSVVIRINYKKFRELLGLCTDLMNFYVNYLEKNWIVRKEEAEVSFVFDDAKARYLKFCNLYPDLVRRLPLKHVASSLGVTSTQLSRIRKELKNQHM